jgi:hypothetical protein
MEQSNFSADSISYSWLRLTKWKVGVFVIFLALASLAIWLLIGTFTGCLFSLGCNNVTFNAFVANILGVWLVLPVYYFVSNFFQPMNLGIFNNIAVAYVIFGSIEILYLYLLACLVTAGIKWYRLQKQVRSGQIIEKTFWALWLPWFILLFDFAALPRRISYIVEYFKGAGFYIQNINTALSISLLAIVELIYFIFLFRNRKRVPWGKFLFWLILIFDAIFCILNFWMLVGTFIAN